MKISPRKVEKYARLKRNHYHDINAWGTAVAQLKIGARFYLHVTILTGRKIKNAPYGKMSPLKRRQLREKGGK